MGTGSGRECFYQNEKVTVTSLIKKIFSSSFLIVNSKVLLIVRLETIFLSSQVPSDERQQQQTTFNRDHDASKLDQRASLLICCANTTR